MNSPSCIDLVITTSRNTFRSSPSFCTKLSDFHKLVVIVLKTSCKKMTSKEIHYGGSNKFTGDDFKTELRQNLSTSSSKYQNFEQAYLALLDKRSLNKSKKIRANHVPYMTKKHRKAIMETSQLKTEYFKTNTVETLRLHKKQKILCSKFYKKERKKYYNSLKLNKVTDNKGFRRTIKPFLESLLVKHNYIN